MITSPRFWFALVLCATSLEAFDRPEVTFQIYQFPANQIPRIDGNSSDWEIVPSHYTIGLEHLIDGDRRKPEPDPASLDVRVRVGWVKGLNRLYFLYEAYDNYWHFASPGLHNDTFEIIVDGDASGGPLVDQSHRDVFRPEIVGANRAVLDERLSVAEAHWAHHGVHAQNYHIFTPAVDKDWAMVWGSPTWIKNLPYANAASRFDFRPGEGGRLVLEFWITPFDYAGPEGPARAVESILAENKLIGLSWIVIDYDDADSRRKDGFWILSRHRNSFADASALPAFRLMPLEPDQRPTLAAQWSFTVADPQRRLVAFRDESVGEVTSWRWDFGDGETSEEQHPVHQYAAPKDYVVILEVTGPAGTSRRSKVWDVQLK